MKEPIKSAQYSTGLQILLLIIAAIQESLIFYGENISCLYMSHLKIKVLTTLKYSFNYSYAYIASNKNCKIFEFKHCSFHFP